MPHSHLDMWFKVSGKPPNRDAIRYRYHPNNIEVTCNALDGHSLHVASITSKNVGRTFFLSADSNALLLENFLGINILLA